MEDFERIYIPQAHLYQEKTSYARPLPNKKIQARSVSPSKKASHGEKISCIQQQRARKTVPVPSHPLYRTQAL